MRDDERILVDEVKGSVDFLSTSKNLLNRKVSKVDFLYRLGFWIYEYPAVFGSLVISYI